MRRKEKEITDIAEIEKIIRKAGICRIGLVDGDEAYIVPVCFGYERNVLYFHGALEGQKTRLIKKNNRVSFQIDTDVEMVKSEGACGWEMKYRSVMGVGRASILGNDEEKVYGLKVLMKQYSADEFSFPKSKRDSVQVVKIDIESMTGKQSGH
jgi:nitroimidazol reductase NimA-like FMN-containing flavoprotein (pyridoxamine 5'-phosphate oxidase superfamily)